MWSRNGKNGCPLFFYFFLNPVAQMQRPALHGGNRAPARAPLVQREQQIVDLVCPKFSHDGRAICPGDVFGVGS
jgi:hypothetical protein